MEIYLNNKPIILIAYDYFFPGYRAGGPVQSLTNLMIALQHQYSFAVLTTGYDLMADEPYKSVELDMWNEISIPSIDSPINIWYASKGNPDYKNLKQLIYQLNPSVIYINGIFSYRFFLLPLLASRNLPSIRIVICPRGMLQSGALSVKSKKKIFYIKTLQITGLLKKSKWHATNLEEANDIATFFPLNKGSVIAYNIPKVPLSNMFIPKKNAGELRLVYLSLITEKKNLKLLLQALQLLPDLVTLDIYGPVKDAQYWQQCKEIIKAISDRVKYMGDIEPLKVQEALSSYHALCILTKGENFGHALYESLSVGRPVITSYYTPWLDLEKSKAGTNADISQMDDCIKNINKLATMQQDEYNTYCNGAYQMSVSYYDSLNSMETYRKLFGEV